MYPALSLVVFTALIAISLTAAPAAQSSQDARAGIEAASRKFEAAAAKGDGAAIAALYTADAMLLPPNSDAIKGSTAISDFWKAAVGAGVVVKFTIIEVSADGDAAHEVGTYAMETPDGKPLDRGKYLVVWKREGGQWKLHRDIWNSNLPGPQP